jgi:hypothetical protein
MKTRPTSHQENKPKPNPTTPKTVQEFINYRMNELGWGFCSVLLGGHLTSVIFPSWQRRSCYGSGQDLKPTPKSVEELSSTKTLSSPSLQTLDSRVHLLEQAAGAQQKLHPLCLSRSVQALRCIEFWTILSLVLC